MNEIVLAVPVLASVGGGWGPGGPWWIFGPLMLLFWVALAATVVWLIVRRTRPAEPTANDRARGILAERFARGELSAEEYRERLEQLQ
ncbi:SHOCT domain-containing protein [Sphaerobacter thermophilus]|uniref:SHOCT domain-containing protein n=1 Tax=Sphaerobacter thermophilus (strain ATCC 49802 / DSM 20745 / KCCM 41009 / NCIMB 13125 / S 6022) TaxID=479434 RepID=D1C684_SPHTD|nr:SHOCT domain-containing protein [Sphaerobacter thermophilus]ACZ37622.1 conserved hypothetical protein [Sphaerobacter thermophilus DSM 20745]